MAAGPPVFGVAGTLLTGANSQAVNFPVPAGVVANSIIVASLYVEDGTATVTPPTGNGVWAEAPQSPVMNTTTSKNYLRIYWKRAIAADSGTYGFTLAGQLAWRVGIACRIDNCVTSGSPWDPNPVQAAAAAAAAAQPAVTGTTAGADRLLYHVAASFDAGTQTGVPSGFTERADLNSGCAQAVNTKAQAAQGSTGSVSGTWSVATTSGRSAWLGALIPDTGPAGQPFFFAA